MPGQEPAALLVAASGITPKRKCLWLGEGCAWFLLFLLFACLVIHTNKELFPLSLPESLLISKSL